MICPQLLDRHATVARVSRQHSYAYVIDSPTTAQLDLWEEVVDNHAALGLYPEAVCDGGDAGPERLNLRLNCNRTKATIYRARLNGVFGTEGRIVALSDAE